MSAHSQQTEATDDFGSCHTTPERKWGITSEELAKRHKSDPPVQKSNERRCEECGNRVTETPDGLEVGHARGRSQEPCSHYNDYQIDLPNLAAKDIAADYASDGEDRPMTPEEKRWGITVDALKRRRQMKARPNKPSERNCDKCGNRITKTASGYEAGHARGRKVPQCPDFEGYALNTEEGSE